MPAPPATASIWALTDKGKIVACPKGLPEGTVLWCREGETAWRRADPAQVARAPAGKSAAAGPGLYDDREGER